MKPVSGMAGVAALVGDPARARMLAALLDGRALTATELAAEAGVTPATASGHLGKLTGLHLVTPAAQGRHRYYRLGSREVARMLEGIMVVAGETLVRGRRTEPRIDPDLRFARTCYDHLAGKLGVALASSLVSRGAVVLRDGAGQVTPSGERLLAEFGIASEDALRARRMYCRPCLDWSERRTHLAGVLGAALLDRLLELRWIQRSPAGRAVKVTSAGSRGLKARFGVEV
ncbi:MAG TPA: winged helix-turn-helix domain-containing protein [Steroidobacteraceae bacterium]|jgi:DNA-binding transcriptional ArsR family regulator|nr:winged helix-turn-helix domain-containing protein [Steroidobacteraceae bacterium]